MHTLKKSSFFFIRSTCEEERDGVKLNGLKLFFFGNLHKKKMCYETQLLEIWIFRDSESNIKIQNTIV